MQLPLMYSFITFSILALPFLHHYIPASAIHVFWHVSWPPGIAIKLIVTSLSNWFSGTNELNILFTLKCTIRPACSLLSVLTSSTSHSYNGYCPHHLTSKSLESAKERTFSILKFLSMNRFRNMTVLCFLQIKSIVTLMNNLVPGKFCAVCFASSFMTGVELDA